MNPCYINPLPVVNLVTVMTIIVSVQKGTISDTYFASTLAIVQAISIAVPPVI